MYFLMGWPDLPVRRARRWCRSSREEPIFFMAKYVIGPDVALHLAHREAAIPGEHQILAPAFSLAAAVAPLPGGPPRRDG